MTVNSEENLEKRLEVKFNNQKLLHLALIHRSYLNESAETESNERLEFLGDAVLEFIVSAKLFGQFPGFDEGELTALRSKLVNTASLANLARELHLGEALYISRGEDENGGRNNPTLLADTFEAVIGALFLDQGIGICQKLLDKLLMPQAARDLTNLKDPKSLLQEIVQRQGNRAPVYKVISEEGPHHAKLFTVSVVINNQSLATGTGKSKKEAQEQAAKIALESI
ncbi:ribonuclease III [Candidatus Microgenomates bacterium]|nr:ribonuclease III [Candidatus Microgenomates bacterium]